MMEELERMPRASGWKHEYDGGRAITPTEQNLQMSIDVTQRYVQFANHIRPLRSGDEPQLVSAFFEAFRCSIEYCNCTPSEICEAARHSIRSFFNGRRGMVLSASRVAFSPGAPDGPSRILGAALVTENGPGSRLDMLFVTPDFQRTGLATSLVSAAMNELHGSGVKVLQSASLLGNRPSREWHLAFGFKEEPDIDLAVFHLRHAEHQLRRLVQNGPFTEANRRTMMQESETWRRLVEMLECSSGTA